MESRLILVYLSIIHNGNWDLIYESVQCRRCYDEDEIYKTIKKIESNYVTILDEDYPEQLKSILKPPFVLFYYGDLSIVKEYDRNISVVGKRLCSKYGEMCVNTLITPIAEKFTVISGMAKGIDSLAHIASINGKGKTAAILGCGIDFCYPSSNKTLYEKLKNEYLVMSEYPGKCEPTQSSFPFRNRIIAGLSKGCLIVEADLRSGSSITARIALEMGRYVMAVPTLINKGSLCNRLIADGAYLIETPDDITYLLGKENYDADFSA